LAPGPVRWGDPQLLLPLPHAFVSPSPICFSRNAFGIYETIGEQQLLQVTIKIRLAPQGCYPNLRFDARHPSKAHAAILARADSVRGASGQLRPDATPKEEKRPLIAGVGPFLLPNY